MKVAVLGCGPAGLIAAHAARHLGHKVSVYSRLEKSVIRGAQVLHAPVEGLDNLSDPFDVNYHKIGDAEGYADKIYGTPNAPTSWETYPEGPMQAWSLMIYYNHLWSQWEASIFDTELSYGQASAIADRHDMVFSTVPLPSIMRSPEWDIFIQQPVNIMSKPMVFNPGPWDGDWIEYDGSESPWYRRSMINGWYSEEYPEEVEVAGTVRITKPLDVVGGDTTRKEIVPAGVTLVGRYGEWRKGRLVHHAQEAVQEALGGV